MLTKEEKETARNESHVISVLGAGDALTHHGVSANTSYISDAMALSILEKLEASGHVMKFGKTDGGIVTWCLPP